MIANSCFFFPLLIPEKVAINVENFSIADSAREPRSDMESIIVPDFDYTSYSHLKRVSLEAQAVFLVTSLAELITNTSPSRNTARYFQC